MLNARNRFISYSSCNRSPHTLWLKTMQFWMAEVQNQFHGLTSKYLAYLAPSGGSHWRICSFTFSPPLLVDTCNWLVAPFLPLQSLFPLSCHFLLFCSLISLSFLVEREPKNDNIIRILSPSQDFFSLVIFAKSPLPCKLTFTDSEVVDILGSRYSVYHTDAPVMTEDLYGPHPDFLMIK